MGSHFRPFFKFLFLVTSISIFGACGENSTKQGDSNNDLQAIKVQTYPETRKSDVVDDYHGTKVSDPYRWLEDDHSDETKAWVKAQNKVTQDFIGQIPYRKDLEDRLKSLWSYSRSTAPIKKGDKYYIFQNNGLQNQDVLYSQSNFEEEPVLVLDPNTFSTDGTSSLGGMSFSKDGKYLAYQVSVGGSDWHSIYILDLENNKTLQDKVEWVKFSEIAWKGNGFYYSRYPEPEGEDKLTGENQNHSLYFHEINTSQAEDRPVYFDRSNPDRGFYASVTEDEKNLVMGAWSSTSGNALYFASLSEEKESFAPVVTDFNHDYTFVNNLGDNILLLTNKDAPNKKLISIPANNVDPNNWVDLIPEAKQVLQSVNLVGDKIVATYIKNASSEVKIFNQNGKLFKEVNLPELGTIQQMEGSKKDNIAYFSFASFKRPASIYSLDSNSGEILLHKAPEIDFDSDKYVTQQVFYTSKDGTEIPMFISHKKDLELDGNRPTMIYGYGGFDISILPGFNTTRLAMAPIIMENDGVFAVANIRGGGEFGKAWHQAGTKSQKQNVFDDFIAAAEYLIEKKYTNSEKLASYGRSNGGLLIGACMTQRPDLYKVALPAVGVLDMLRYEKFTIGWAWATDYGSAAKPDDFKYLHAYSPLHNVNNKSYPATMVTTADHDDRVVPAHSFKFISELQDKHQGENPVLIRIGISAGHGAGKSTTEKIKEGADILAFMYYNIGEAPYL